MVSCVGIKGLYPILPVVHQPDGQVLICQGDVVRKIIDAWEGADELPRGWVVVFALVEEDLVKYDWQPFFWVAGCDANRKGRLEHDASTSAHSGQPRVPLLSSVSLWSRGPRGTYFSFLSLRSRGSLFASLSLVPFLSSKAQGSSLTSQTFKKSLKFS